MKTLRLLFALACAVTTASMGWAQTLVANQALAFGSFSAGASAGTVTISAAGARGSGGGVFLISSGSGAAASFTVTGTPGATYSITLPDNGVVSMALAGNPGTTMAVNNFVSNPVATSGSTGLLTGGTQILTVGATLSVGSNQASGSYSGSFNVTVNIP
ncbi:MAG: DUF4402 domain-containing protein [Pseudomonadota bacterium]|uniref:DUF4402 domain-containing protein n=1 Tax=Polaromonas sp. YR568 TaxID=1855301 RepID=UPI00272876EA|nr:DUF4402 domain-containing protein [Polaromonas sp.]